MLTFHVPDMTCGHCAGTITRALKDADPQARVGIDLGRHLVTIEPAAASSDDLRAAIADAGYSPVAAPALAAAASAAKAGCGCGCR